MPNSSGTWKTGERVVTTGTYECINCRQIGKTTHLTLESGKIFPYCTVDELKDNTYKLLPAKKR